MTSTNPHNSLHYSALTHYGEIGQGQQGFLCNMATHSGHTHTQELYGLDELTFYKQSRALGINKPIRTAPQNVNSMVGGCYSGEFGDTVHTRCV